MKKIFTIFLLFSFLPALSKAEVYSCYFTEPFFLLLISTDENQVQKYDYLTKEFETLNVINSHLLEPQLLLELENGSQILIDKSVIGSDGMSDKEYPYHVEYDQLMGGCEDVQVEN